MGRKLLSNLAHNENGSVSLLAAVFVAAFVSLAGVAVYAAAGVIGIHRAQVAADMASVSAAHEHYVGGDGCAEAAEVIRLNGADLSDCFVEGMDVVVRAEMAGGDAVARAGPVE
ncbi:Rv3654c family TadE-like protein [Corynebacterium vitaeruminis]|uniref:Rv3654c family TadE-like protein n=1 Tax=Corynebacterium vitaeruminis TaxID=38305 RepID=UPI00055134DA|nr:Rv3654c family TadE-like protein [Corynebacterium vitaeruminis]